MKNHIVMLVRTLWVLALLVGLPLAATLDRGPQAAPVANGSETAPLPPVEVAGTWDAPAPLRAPRPELPEPAPISATTVAQDDPFSSWHR